MANRFRGEIDLKAGEETFTLRFGTNAIVRLEELTKKGIVEIGAQIGAPGYRPTMREVREFVFCGLVDQHEEIDSLKKAGDVIDLVGMMPAFNAVLQSLQASFPEAEAEKAEPGKEGKGQSPSRGNGASSSRTRRRLASAPPSSGN